MEDNSIQRIYETTYAALYEWTIKRWYGNEYIGSFAAATGFGIVMGMNVVTLVVVYRLVTGHSVPIPSSLVGAIVVLPLAINYRVFIWNDKYAEILHRFTQRRPKEKRRAKIGAWTYVFASFLIALIVAFFLPERTG
jgi:hypothetical protein